ncbi:efflux RND transporter permease subunit, partial [Chromatium okenii]|uniref:efflux RND transporter permease subunit n=1 Tax=Chromatium okenii TaxID=61644 RepID=UPI0026EA43F5
QMSWEWAGEWTVTYETFRDMGAAFVVALVLIYILVVWEFGNFRIPLVIMAPIPLTLLGIIPAHSLMFALGMGGEFTATSMIGWIALAGIIVRNSILLVDFAIHEIHTGVPVDEAMIRACKIRTRPILITALALVAGSSVIITDPIFQGMAISLLSGVLVSTVLTLIVIPLGCVAASKDMCEIAGASAPPGVSLPCRLMNKKGKTGRGLFGWIAEIMTLAFYLLRGIGLLLWEAFKGLLPQKPKKPAITPKSSPPPVVTPVPEEEVPMSEVEAPATESPTKPSRSATKKTVAPAEAPAPKPAAAPQKKPSRRGIRLKTDDESDQDKS